MIIIFFSTLPNPSNPPSNNLQLVACCLQLESNPKPFPLSTCKTTVQRFIMKRSLLSLSLLSVVLAYGQQAAFNYLPTSTTHQIVRHTYYTLSYSERDEQAEWVAYTLTAAMVTGTVKRSGNFRADPYVATGSATPGDYKNSGYDRGHLAPAADMAFSPVAMSECFYMSNMSPMVPSFNRGIWEKLEEQVRTWATDYRKIYVITGGILKYSMGKIGCDGVTVPRYFYKIVMDDTEPAIKAIAFILPNEKSEHQLYDYAVTIDSVESLTGIDFFPALPDKIEESLESHIDVLKWSFTPIHFPKKGAKE